MFDGLGEVGVRGRSGQEEVNFSTVRNIQNTLMKTSNHLAPVRGDLYNPRKTNYPRNVQHFPQTSIPSAEPPKCFCDNPKLSAEHPGHYTIVQRDVQRHHITPRNAFQLRETLCHSANPQNASASYQALKHCSRTPNTLPWNTKALRNRQHYRGELSATEAIPL